VENRLNMFGIGSGLDVAQLLDPVEWVEVRLGGSGWFVRQPDQMAASPGWSTFQEAAKH
jgi:hypothetical protein